MTDNYIYSRGLVGIVKQRNMTGKVDRGGPKEEMNPGAPTALGRCKTVSPAHTGAGIVPGVISGVSQLTSPDGRRPVFRMVLPKTTFGF